MLLRVSVTDLQKVRGFQTDLPLSQKHSIFMETCVNWRDLHTFRLRLIVWTPHCKTIIPFSGILNSHLFFNSSKSVHTLVLFSQNSAVELCIYRVEILDRQSPERCLCSYCLPYFYPLY